MAMAFYLDITCCSGCQACIVACLDQNDLVNKENHDFWRQVYTVENGCYPEVKISYVSQACMHCEESPCEQGCPTGAIYKEEDTGIIGVRQELCIGCHSCSLACPFGVPRFNQSGKMEKCQMCKDRVEHGLEPACVQICPTKALKFGEVNELMQQVGNKASTKLISTIRKDL